MLDRLDDTQWRIVRVRSEDAMVGTLEDAAGTEFTFLGDGRFGGSTGCNRFFGQFTTQPDGSLHAGPVGVTMMMCPDDRMTQERLVLAAVEATTEIVEHGDTLALRDAAGRMVMELGRPEAPELPSP